MTDEQLISGAQALLDLDARGALIPHGIGGHARTIIEGFLALSRRVPASGDEYVPCIIRNDSAGFYEFVTEDVPALYGGMMAANVERIGKLQGGDLIGFRIYDETPIPEGKAEPGEAVKAVEALREWMAIWDAVCNEADPDDDKQPPKWEIARLAMMPWMDPLGFPSAEYFSSYMHADLVYRVRDLLHGVKP